MIFFPDLPKPSSAEPVMKENTEIIRKRRPINFTLDDLIENYSEDENWVSDLTTNKGFETTKKRKNIKKKRSSKPKNKEFIRKRRPINFTLDDLNDDENEDGNFEISTKTSKNGKKLPDTNIADR